MGSYRTQTGSAGGPSSEQVGREKGKFSVISLVLILALVSAELWS